MHCILMMKGSIDFEISEYVEHEIIPLYAGFDAAHRQDHARAVIDRSLKIASDIGGVEANMVYVVAAFHDLGLKYGRERHHEDSRKILETDTFLNTRFSPSQIRLMGEAVEDHRASSKRPPRNIYGLIVAEADRLIDADIIIRRTIQYGLSNYPEMDECSQLQRARLHLEEKYGDGGYLNIWIPDSENDRRLQELRLLIRDTELLDAMLKCAYDKETKRASNDALSY